MMELSYRRHRFPPVVIQHAVWLYLRFTLSYRDVEDLLAERGLDISYETVRSWVLKFGPVIARRLRRSRPRPSNRWHLDGARTGVSEQQSGRELASACTATRTLVVRASTSSSDTPVIRHRR
jgi:putative transposase